MKKDMNTQSRRAKEYDKILNTADVDWDVELFTAKMLDNKDVMNDPELSRAVIKLYGIFKEYSYGHIYNAYPAE